MNSEREGERRWERLKRSKGKRREGGPKEDYYDGKERRRSQREVIHMG